MSDFNLSNHVVTDCLDKEFDKPHFKILDIESVAEFIKKIKENFCAEWIKGECNYIEGCTSCKKIDKLSGNYFALAVEDGSK